MYTLTLTTDERKAIDWVGNRYWHGDRLFTLLWCHSKTEPNDGHPDREWDSSEPITFKVPEHVAWIIKEEAEKADYAWDCFADELASKLSHFCMKIV